VGVASVVEGKVRISSCGVVSVWCCNHAAIKEKGEEERKKKTGEEGYEIEGRKLRGDCTNCAGKGGEGEKREAALAKKTDTGGDKIGGAHLRAGTFFGDVKDVFWP